MAGKYINQINDHDSHKKIRDIAQSYKEAIPSPHEMKAIIHELCISNIGEEKRKNLVETACENALKNLIMNGRFFYELRYSFENSNYADLLEQEYASISVEVIDKFRELGYIVVAEKYGYMISLP